MKRSDRTLYWDESKTTLLEANDPAQAFLAIHEGGEIDEHWLKQTGCRFENERIVLPGEPEATTETEPEVEEQPEATTEAKKAKGGK